MRPGTYRAARETTPSTLARPAQFFSEDQQGKIGRRYGGNLSSNHTVTGIRRALSLVATAKAIERLAAPADRRIEMRVRASSDFAGPAILVVYFKVGLPFREMFSDFAKR